MTSVLWRVSVLMNKETLFEKYTTVLKPLPTEMRPGGRLRSEIRAILFDIYGTLFISGAGDIGTATARGGISRAMGDLLRQHGIQEDQSAVLKRLDQAITHRHEELGREGVDHPEVEIDKIWAKVLDNEDMAFVRNFAVEYECIVNPVYPMPYLRELVTACANKGITMGIVSNAQFYTPDLFRWFLDADSESLGFRPDLTFYSYEFGHAKPSRKIFQAAADALADIDIPTDSALYLGNDMLNDIYPANALGFQTALFAGDARSLRLRKDDPRCEGLTPDLIITDLSQLLDKL